MYHYGRLAVLGLSPENIDPELYSLFLDDDLIARLEAYREKLNRQSELIMTPERAYWLTYLTTIGTEEQKKTAAAKAAYELTPPEQSA